MTGLAITSKMETDKMPRDRGLTGEDGGTSRGADEVLALCSRTRTERHTDAHAPHSGGARAAWCAR